MKQSNLLTISFLYYFDDIIDINTMKFFIIYYYVLSIILFIFFIHSLFEIDNYC